MDKKWYLAGILEEFTVGDEPDKQLYVNWILVNAVDAEEAYAKALVFGERHTDDYLNPDDVMVKVRFRGLSDLLEIYEELEDGAEIVYDVYENITEAEVEAKIRPKSELSVFRPRKKLPWEDSMDE